MTDLSTQLEKPEESSNEAPQGRQKATSSMDRVPALGYRNYWYPALQSHEVKSKPVHLKMLGDDIVFFRDAATGAAHAMADRCPHRNASLSLGKSHYPGTLTCPYHGWTFNLKGDLVAVLSEGPKCAMVGKVQQRVYPVEEFRGFLWVWMGDMAAVPLSEDLPPELNDLGTSLFTDVQVWKANWRVVTENTDGYHAPILHLESMPRTLYMDWVSWRKITHAKTDDGLGVIHVEIDSADTDEFPGLGVWPKIPNWKRAAKNFFGAKVGHGRRITLPDGRTGSITEDIHLPGWRRVQVRVMTTFVEWAVPIDEHTTRHVLWDVVHADKNAGPVRRMMKAARLALFRYLIYPTYWRWAYNKKYVGQDKDVLESMYQGPEYLQANDAGILAWRKLSERARGYKRGS
jgi:phenylpropionate dioxygenase-like ring-hydroxylating dioxygenase large terminal subunit